MQVRKSTVLLIASLKIASLSLVAFTFSLFLFCMMFLAGFVYLFLLFCFYPAPRFCSLAYFYLFGKFLTIITNILPFHTIHGVLEIRILMWFAIPSSGGPRFVRTLHYDPSILGWPCTACFLASLSYTGPFSTTRLWSKEIKWGNPKRNQPWIFIGRTGAEAPILWPPDAKNQLIRKDHDAGKDWRQKEKAVAGDAMVI